MPDQQPGGLNAAGAGLEPLLGDHAAPEQGLAQHLERLTALFRRIPGGVEGGGVELDPQPLPVHHMFDRGRAEAGGHAG